MTCTRLRALERDLERLFRGGILASQSDAQLLERFVANGDPEAFEGLVARHRELLLRTCHDLLGDAVDAEEAFQATVVILMHRAGSIREKDAIGGWLHRVACRVARRAPAFERPAAGQRKAGRRDEASRGNRKP